jgi:gliding motility-associated protein GldM
MSIPKEPRQLMINLMYLVLTAMLALNVSAEIINAFLKIDKGIVATNDLLTKANDAQLKSMASTSDKKTQYKPLTEAAQKATTIVQEFNSYIAGVKANVIKEAGGLYPADYKEVAKRGMPVRFKDKEIPQRLFVDGSKDGKTKAMGPEVKAKVLETRDKLIALVEGIKKLKIEGTKITDAAVEDLKTNLPLNVDDATWKANGKKSWEQFNFGYMPVAATLPILARMQNDAKNAESSIINYLAGNMGVTVIEFNKFEPVSSAEKGYVIEGEKYAADVFLSTFSSGAQISARVNGSSVPLKDGKGHYEVTASGLGEKQYKVDITLNNPLTGKSETFSKSFKYEVGRRSVAIQLDKMNVFYIGVDNPISVSAAGVSSNQLKVSGSGVDINPGSGGGKYVVRGSRIGPATITVSAPGISQSFDYKVKKIPDPVPMLGNKRGGAIGNGEIKAYDGITAFLENFDFDAKCSIQGYDVVYIPKRNDAVLAPNSGGNFNGKANEVRNLCKPGDQFLIQNIKARCPGDAVGRDIGSMAFLIK